jgi:hypothetical protein
MTFRGSANFSDEGAIVQSHSILAAQAGTLTTRTGNTEGNATLSTGHGITTGLLVDLYWTGGVRRGVIVGTVAVNVVPFSGGTGDNLPIQDTAISVAPVTESEMRFDAKDMKFLAFTLTGAGRVVFLGESDVELYTHSLSASYIHRWDDLSGYDNPIEDDSSSMTDVCNIRISSSSTTATTFKIGVLLNTL